MSKLKSLPLTGGLHHSHSLFYPLNHSSKRLLSDFFPFQALLLREWKGKHGLLSAAAAAVTFSLLELLPSSFLSRLKLLTFSQLLSSYQASQCLGSQKYVRGDIGCCSFIRLSTGQVIITCDVRSTPRLRKTLIAIDIIAMYDTLYHLLTGHSLRTNIEAKDRHLPRSKVPIFRESQSQLQWGAALRWPTALASADISLQHGISNPLNWY